MKQFKDFIKEAYSPSNPKIDIHVNGEYHTSTNWSNNIKHANSDIKGYIDKKSVRESTDIEEESNFFKKQKGFVRKLLLKKLKKDDRKLAPNRDIKGYIDEVKYDGITRIHTKGEHTHTIEHLGDNKYSIKNHNSSTPFEKTLHGSGQVTKWLKNNKIYYEERKEDSIDEVLGYKMNTKQHRTIDRFFDKVPHDEGDFSTDGKHLHSGGMSGMLAKHEDDGSITTNVAFGNVSQTWQNKIRKEAKKRGIKTQEKANLREYSIDEVKYNKITPIHTNGEHTHTIYHYGGNKYNVTRHDTDEGRMYRGSGEVTKMINRLKRIHGEDNVKVDIDESKEDYDNGLSIESIAIMGDKKTINTKHGVKNVGDIHNMMSSLSKGHAKAKGYDDEGHKKLVDSIMNGKSHVNTTWGKKSKLGISYMVHGHNGLTDDDDEEFNESNSYYDHNSKNDSDEVNKHLSSHAAAIINNQKRISTGYGDKTGVGISNMMSSVAKNHGDDNGYNHKKHEEIVDAIMNGNTHIKTGWGKKSRLGVSAMVRGHNGLEPYDEPSGTANESLTDAIKSFTHHATRLGLLPNVTSEGIPHDNTPHGISQARGKAATLNARSGTNIRFTQTDTHLKPIAINASTEFDYDRNKFIIEKNGIEHHYYVLTEDDVITGYTYSHNGSLRKAEQISAMVEECSNGVNDKKLVGIFKKVASDKSI